MICMPLKAQNVTMIRHGIAEWLKVGGHPRRRRIGRQTSLTESCRRTWPCCTEFSNAPPLGLFRSARRVAGDAELTVSGGRVRLDRAPLGDELSCLSGAVSYAVFCRRTPLKRFQFALVALLAAAFLTGCSPDESPSESPAAPDRSSEQAAPAEPTTPAEPAEEVEPETTETASGPVTREQLEAALKEKNPNFKGEVFIQMGPQGIAAVGISDPAIEDISPLAGLPLYRLDLPGCHISDVTVLKGMKLGQIDLSNTAVSDISVLAGMPLDRAYLNKTRIKDSSALSDIPFQHTDPMPEALHQVEQTSFYSDL